MVIMPTLKMIISILSRVLLIGATVSVTLKRRARRRKVSKESDPLTYDLGMVTHICVCGCDTWKILATFDDYEIASYSLDMYCSNCGAKARTPTPLDDPESPYYCEE